jgi:folate-binding protein YgfZ
MTAPFYFERPDRGVITVAGPDRASFLQGLISNDVAKAGPARAVWAAFLTPQGKFRHDFFLVEQAGEGVGLPRLLLVCEAGDRLRDLGVGLRRFVLRDAVRLGLAAELGVFQIAGDDAAAALGLAARPGAAKPVAGGVAFVDPRLAAGGVTLLAAAAAARAALAEAGVEPGDRADWERTRIRNGLPDGARDLQVDKAILLENGFDELGGVDWRKGCYLGQELTARTKYRGLVKKRLIPVRLAGAAAPEPGAPVTRDGKTVGELRSVADGWALALVRVKALDPAGGEGAALQTGGVRVVPAIPDWMRLPQDAPA